MFFSSNVNFDILQDRMPPDRKRPPDEQLVFTQTKRTIGNLASQLQESRGQSDKQMANSLGITKEEWAAFKNGGGDDYLKVMAKLMKSMHFELPES